MKYFKKLLNEYLTLKWPILFIFLFVFGFMIRQRIMKDAYDQQIAINHWDVLFNFWGDPMIIIYFFIPIWVFLCIRLILNESQDHVLIRLKTWIGWMRYIAFKLHFLLVITITIWIIVSLLLTIGIPYEASWSSWALNDSYSNYLVSSFTHLNTSPSILILLQMTLFVFFMVCLSTLLSTAYLLTNRLFVLIGLGLFLYLGSIISFKMLPLEWTWLNVTSYVVLIFSYTYFQSLWAGFGFLAVITLLCWTVAVLKSSKHEWKRNFIRVNMPLLIYILLCLIGFLVRGNYPGISNAWDQLYMSLYGVGQSGFRLTTYLYFCIVFLGFIYLFQLRLNNVLDGRIYYLLIRHKSLTSWFVIFFLKGCMLALLLIFSLLSLTILVGIINGQGLSSPPTVANVPPFEILYHFVVNGILQIANYMLLSFIAIWFWRESNGGLIALGVFLVGGIPYVNMNQWFPFALNSLGYLSPDHNVYRDSVILLLFFLIEMIGVFYIFHRRKIVF